MSNFADGLARADIERDIQDGMNRAMADAGLPLVQITTEDRLRGALMSVCSMLEAGSPGAAYKEALEALKL